MFEIYKKITLNQIPRIMGLGDRQWASGTFGCFDRNYWHYKIFDFPNARFQEVSFLLTLLFSHKFEGNIYYSNQNIMAWLLSSIRFWSENLNANGSANEVYPFENSFCATSFSAYRISESLLRLKKTDFINMLHTAHWLAKMNNLEVSNQMAAAATALYNFYEITGNREFLSACELKLNKLYVMQNKQGFYLEYGGIDIGYHTLTMSVLARLHKKKKDDRIFNSLLKAEVVLRPLIDALGNFNYEKTSRRTQFIYPFGLAYLNSDIIKSHLRGLNENKILNPSWIDDRYVIQFTSDYLDTYLEFS